jgi:type III pantothenate kinase
MNRTPESMLLAIDVGNTSVKFGQFRMVGVQFPEPEAVFRTDARSPDYDQLARWLPKGPTWCFLSSVYRQAAQEIAEWLCDASPEYRVEQLQTDDFSIEIEVRSPDRVGHDRLASAIACCQLKQPTQPAIVVDAGSAITVDAISAGGSFLGGAILAGQQASALALSAGTDLLPLISTIRLDRPPPAVGDSTENAILSGVFWGTIGAIREIIQRVQGDLGTEHQIFLTGGDVHRLAHHVAPEGRVIPNLVLSGIALAARDKMPKTS